MGKCNIRWCVSSSLSLSYPDQVLNGPPASSRANTCSIIIILTLPINQFNFPVLNVVRFIFFTQHLHHHQYLILLTSFILWFFGPQFVGWQWQLFPIRCHSSMGSQIFGVLECHHFIDLHSNSETSKDVTRLMLTRIASRFMVFVAWLPLLVFFHF